MKRLVKSLVDVLCPDICLLCGDTLLEGEEKICLNCVVELTVADFMPPFTDNPLTERLATLRADVVRATAFMRYERGNASSRLVQEVKYNNRPSAALPIICHHIPILMSQGFFSDVDLLMPVPQHWTRLLERGYSQTLYMARAISRLTSIPVARNLYAARPHRSQTTLDVEERRQNVVDVFDVRRPSELKGKHILLVEDVVTTGSTVYNVMTAISRQEPTARFSVYTLSLTV